MNATRSQYNDLMHRRRFDMPWHRVALLAWMPVAFGSVAVGEPPPPIAADGRLPTEHAHQRVIRDYLATLQPADLAVATGTIEPVDPATDDERHRLWILGRQDVAGLAAARMPPESFTLASLESRPGLALPAAVSDCQGLAWLARWDFAGNPWRGSRPLLLRAFILAAVDAVMLDHLHERSPQGVARSDFLGGNLIWIVSTWAATRDVLPPPVAEAFHAAIAKLVRRMKAWGPTGLMTDMDLFAPVALGMLEKLTDDEELRRICLDYSRPLFTERRFYHPAGYFVDHGCFDVSYNGISLYFATWAALITEWPFAVEAVRRAHDLRAHLHFPDPAGGFSGPAHMSSRTSGDAPRDQWQFDARIYGAAMLTDTALWRATPAAPQDLERAATTTCGRLNAVLGKPAAPRGEPWREVHWSRAINYAHDLYRAGFLDRWRGLQDRGDPILQPVFRRDGSFVRAFDEAFVVVKLDGYGAAVHIGPVGKAAGHEGRPFGFGGGQLSTFWTPETGAAIVGRRRGVQGKVFDSWDEWRSWPVHAVTGTTAAGRCITSARITDPEVRQDLEAAAATIDVSGELPEFDPEAGRTTGTGWRYERRFELRPGAVSVTTRVRPDPRAAHRVVIGELHESLPVLLRETARQPAAVVRFLRGREWTEATADATAGVAAVRIDRFGGSVVVEFSETRTVRLAPDTWTDGYQTRAECRSVLVDLPADASGGRALGYRIAPLRE